VGSNTIVIHSAGDANIGPLVDAEIDTAANGLSMMAREVQCDGTSANVNGQRSSIFQSKCKIQNKVCKLIIDGVSFTNVISSDVVHSLSLSTRRLPMPRYILSWSSARTPGGAEPGMSGARPNAPRARCATRRARRRLVAER
jgi:hypothetical protein